MRWLLGEAAMVLLLLLVFSQKASAQADWTFMVYLDGDNNLESAGIDDFLEISSVVGLTGEGAAVRVVVQFDRISGYDSSYENWTTCKRFEITAGITPIEGNQVSDLGEVNMGDLDILTDFINWAITNYPAGNYALVLWNHGSGWREILERKKVVNLSWKAGEDWRSILKEGESTKYVCYDETSADYLYMDEVETALNNANDINLLGFDACLMGMVEVAYEISKSTNAVSIMVGSEEAEPEDGWPYDTILTDLVNADTDLGHPMTPTELGTTIVNKYGAYYEDMGNQGTTQSAIDLSQMSNLAAAIDNFATAMSSNWSEIKSCRENSQEYYTIEHIDLYHFADLVSNNVTDSAIVARADAVKTAVNNGVIAEYHGTGQVYSNGLAIYFPNREDGFYERCYEGATYDLSADTGWDEFLKQYLINASPVPTISSSWLSVTPTIDGEISADEWTDATAIDITNTGVTSAVTAYIKNDTQYLYLAIDDPNDTTLDDNDQVGIYFDDDHNHQWDSEANTDEGNYWCYYDGTVWRNLFRGIYDDGTYPYQSAATVAAADVISSGSIASGNMQYEIRIDLITGAFQSTVGSTIGFYSFCYDSHTDSRNGEWSNGFNDSGAWQEPLHYGHLTLAEAPVVEDGGNGGGGGCFIATAAYGTEMAEEVKTLTKFRDDVLLKTIAGKEFVELYYAISPPIAEFIRNKPIFRAITRIALQPLIWITTITEELYPRIQITRNLGIDEEDE